MEKITACPLCTSAGFETHINARDYFLSREPFTIVRCSECGFLFTNPRPEKKEIGNYYKDDSYISHTDSDKGIVNRIYQLVRNKTLNEKAKWIAKHKPSGNVLDFGAGTGHFLQTMRKKGYSVEGVEPDGSARKVAAKKFNLDLHSDLTYLLEKEKHFDVITMWHVLEHVHDLDPTLKKIKTLLSDDGLLVVAVPNPESYDARYYKKYWAAYDLPRHLYHFTRDTLTQCLNHHRFDLIHVHPMKFDAYYVSMLSEKYRSGKARYFNALLRGFLSNLFASGKTPNYSSLTYLFTNKN